MFILGLFLLIVFGMLYVEDEAYNVEIVDDIPPGAKEVKGKRVY